jgi:hypothetical protein
VRRELERLADVPNDPEALEHLRKLWNMATPGEIQQIEIEPSRDYCVAHLASPVFGPEGQVCLEIVMRNLPEHLSGQQVLDLADRLRTACGSATRRTHGRAPETARRLSSPVTSAG